VDDIVLEMVRLKARGYCCTQIILILALKAQGKTNADLVRSMGGLCYGVNWGGEVCGALSGGACLISLYTGKGADVEIPHDQHLVMIGEFVEWFIIAADEKYGGTRCHEILEKFPDRSICSLIVADTYKKCMDILVKNGFDRAINTSR